VMFNKNEKRACKLFKLLANPYMTSGGGDRI
jgi:hypothetical protein